MLEIIGGLIILMRGIDSTPKQQQLLSFQIQTEQTVDGHVAALFKDEMKTFNEFVNFFKKETKPPVPKDVKVLAYKNYKPGVLNKTTGEFTQRDHTPDEAARYGWKPVKTSSYGPRDTTSQAYNTGKDNVQRTADGTPFTGSTRGVAVPYKYKKGEVPKGTWAGTPSIKFGTKVQFTPKPCLLYTSPSPRDQRGSRMPSSA